jgi:hypothetical protein
MTRTFFPLRGRRMRSIRRGQVSDVLSYRRKRVVHRNQDFARWDAKRPYTDRGEPLITRYISPRSRSDAVVVAIDLNSQP